MTFPGWTVRVTEAARLRLADARERALAREAASIEALEITGLNGPPVEPAQLLRGALDQRARVPFAMVSMVLNVAHTPPDRAPGVDDLV